MFLDEDMLVSEIETEEDDWTEIVIIPWQHICPNLDNFEKWLLGAVGKSKSPLQAKQHRRQVEAVLRNVSDGSFDIAALFNWQELRQKWLNSFEKSRKVHTVKTYIYSLLLLYKYLVCDRLFEFRKNLDDCPGMAIIIQNLISIFRVKAKKQQW